MRSNQTIKQIKEAVRDKYAWPGGYPMFLGMNDGGAICMKCARKEWRNIYHSWKHNIRDGWKPEGATINYEDPHLFCDHCSQRIESAYAEDKREYIGGLYCICLEMDIDDARSVSQPGQDATEAVKVLTKKPEIRNQLASIDPETLKKELREYGAWDDEELADHQENLARFVWLAGCDISENETEEE